MLQIEAAVRKLSQESIQYLGLLGKRNFYCVSRNVLRESKLVSFIALFFISITIRKLVLC